MMRTLTTPTRRRAIGGRRPPGQRGNIIVTRPPPVGGWDAKNSLALMDPTSAVLLDNWFPGEGKVEVRGGRTEHATGVGSGNVETVTEYNAGTTRKLLAAGGGSIYDASAAGAVGAALASGFSANRWQSAMMNADLGLVNGTDAPQVFNGSTISAMTVSGPTIANLIGINIFKSRSYFWEEDSQDFWYSAVNTLGGTLTQFPLNRVGSFGGNLIAMGTWTLDAGRGVDDMAVFIMSSGQTIIYNGSNPGDAADWSLVGVFDIGAPLDVRGIVKFAGDLIVMTKEGYQPLKRILNIGSVGEVGSISDQISGAVIEAARDFDANTGWQAILYPRGNKLLFNVPVSDMTFHQHVVNTLTGAWTRFTGWGSRSWGLFNDELYFGGTDGTVSKADTGTTDNGTAIAARSVGAFDYLDQPSQKKSVAALNPVLSSAGTINFGIQAHADFEFGTIPNDPYSHAGTLSAESFWESITTDWEDTTLVYGTVQGDTFKKWITSRANGFSIATQLSLESSISVQWFATNMMLKSGGPL